MPVHRPLCYLDYYIRAYRLAREAPSDIYHGHDLNALPVAWWARRRLGGRLVYDSHEIYTEVSSLTRTGRRAAAIVERFLIRRADAVITIHDTAADELSRRYGVARPTVVKNCPRTPAGCARTTWLRDAAGLRDTDLIVLYQGGLTANRGLPNLVRAMRHLSESAKLVMLGWGPIEPELRALAADLDLLDRRVFFVPGVPQKELLQWTAGADVGVIPYQAVGLNNYFCMPNKLFEYMAAGVAIAASALPELTRIIEGNQVGLTFDPEDPESIGSAIAAILGDPSLRARMSDNARKAALVYNWENEEKNLLAVYAEMVV